MRLFHAKIRELCQKLFDLLYLQNRNRGIQFKILYQTERIACREARYLVCKLWGFCVKIGVSKSQYGGIVNDSSWRGYVNF